MPIRGKDADLPTVTFPAPRPAASPEGRLHMKHLNDRMDRGKEGILAFQAGWKLAFLSLRAIWKGKPIWAFQAKGT